jgi:hypothetical protein
MSRSRISVAALVAVALGATACSDNNPPTVPSEPSDDPSLRAVQGEAAHPNDLARGVKGFGGFFLDAQGVPTIYLKDAAQKENAGRALGRYFQAAGLNPSQLRVLRGQFEWAELERWQAEGGKEALAIAGVVFTDADEASNRLRIGVENGAAAAAVKAALARHGVPEAGVIVETTDPILQMATLQTANDRSAGIQINFDPDPTAAGSYVCTLGFNDGTANFITCSHCTNVQGGLGNKTVFGQPLLSSGIVADEVNDPDYFTGGACPSGRRCRYSDAARAAYRSGITGRRGVISRTAAPNQKRNALEITGTFTISAEDLTSGVVGDVANKIGRTTGWTQGKITNVGVNTNVSGSTITQLGQTFVSAGVNGGDSGSPVFALGSGTNVTLKGILWGGASNGRSFVYSPLGNVERSTELGGIASF